MKWRVLTFALVVAGLVSACGSNTCQPGYYNTSSGCNYPAGYQPGGYYPQQQPYPPQGTGGYYGTGQQPYNSPYGNPYNRPYGY